MTTDAPGRNPVLHVYPVPSPLSPIWTGFCVGSYVFHPNVMQLSSEATDGVWGAICIKAYTPEQAEIVSFGWPRLVKVCCPVLVTIRIVVSHRCCAANMQDPAGVGGVGAVNVWAGLLVGPLWQHLTGERSSRPC